MRSTFKTSRLQGRYGGGPAGFLAYFGNQSAAFDRCQRAHGVRRCVLRFEALGPEQADLYYHADQLLKGMYSVFLREWRSVSRTAEHYQPLIALPNRSMDLLTRSPEFRNRSLDL